MSSFPTRVGGERDGGASEVQPGNAGVRSRPRGFTREGGREGTVLALATRWWDSPGQVAVGAWGWGKNGLAPGMENGMG